MVGDFVYEGVLRRKFGEKKNGQTNTVIPIHPLPPPLSSSQGWSGMGGGIGGGLKSALKRRVVSYHGFHGRNTRNLTCGVPRNSLHLQSYEFTGIPGGKYARWHFKNRASSSPSSPPPPSSCLKFNCVQVENLTQCVYAAPIWSLGRDHWHAWNVSWSNRRLVSLN